MFLPATREEMLERGWHSVDVVLVTGDAYVDHPSFGVVLIGRLLESRGYRVAVLSQPRYNTSDDFKAFGRPRLFFGITSGNLDSIVSNYTGNGRVRKQDSYSPDGNPYFGDEHTKASRRRPDRCTILYSNLARQAYSDTKVVIGGLEASLRRFVHYDFQQAKLRASILSDSKADLLVFGMGEKAVLEIAERLDQNKGLQGIAGTCERFSDKELKLGSFQEKLLKLPSWQAILDNKSLFLEAELSIDSHSRSLSQKPVLQRQQSMWVLQHPASSPLTSAELDDLYSLPFVRAPHPEAGDVPAYRMIRHSVTIVRGCSGNCSFCAISRHQGPLTISRSRESIVREVETISKLSDFNGTISDLGGPTANLYGTSCEISQSCKKHDCLYPKICRHLKIDEDVFIDLLKRVSSINGVKHAYVSSGLRMELLLRTPRFLERLLKGHIPGSMKIAPEHTEKDLLRLMHKNDALILPQFLKTCRKISERLGIKIQFTPYIISAHPGCSLKSMNRLAAKVRELGLNIRLFQDFTPTPGTISSAMYVSELDRDTKKPVTVIKNSKDKKKQRAAVENISNPQKGMGRR